MRSLCAWIQARPTRSNAVALLIAASSVLACSDGGSPSSAAGAGAGGGGASGTEVPVPPGIDDGMNDAAAGSAGVAGLGSGGTGGEVGDGGASLDGGDAATAEEPSAIVTLEHGVLEGSIDGETRVFLGIPYAAPPIGTLRFAPPQPAPPWQDPLQATEHGPACPQPTDGLPQDEDCLTLDVYTPLETPPEGAPVMVFLHGGSGDSGSSSQYDGRWLSRAGELVVVTINYRLGPLAWFVHSDLEGEINTTSGNLGIRDQQHALRWVRDNIAAFGGDPSSVTLFGESHGAMATCLHMFATGSESLAHRYIMQSGGCVGSAVGPGTRAGMEAKSLELATALCPNSADVVVCLRELDAATIARTALRKLPLEEAQGPYVDGELFSARPRQLLEEGRYRRAPILLGGNLHETSFLASDHYGGPDDWPLAATTLELTIGLAFMYPDDWAAAVEHYGPPVSDADANRVMVSIMDDSWLRCPARRLAEGAAARGDAVYFYSFDLAPAVHTLELDYVFGDPTAPFSRLFEGAPVPAIEAVVDRVQGYWTRFARTGDPNGAGAPAWPAFGTTTDHHISLGETVTQGSGHIEAHCNFWATTVAGSR